MLRVKSDKRLITPVHLKTTIHLRQWWGGLNVEGEVSRTGESNGEKWELL